MKLKKPGGLFRESAGLIEPGHSLNTPCLVSLQSHSPVVRAAEQIKKKNTQHMTEFRLSSNMLILKYITILTIMI